MRECSTLQGRVLTCRVVFVYLPTRSLDRLVNQPQQEGFGKQGFCLLLLLKKHVFFNTNERTAWLSMITFLAANGYATNFPQKAEVDFTMEVTNYQKSFDELKEEVTVFLKNNPFIKEK